MSFRKLSLGMELEACTTGYESALPREVITEAINGARIDGLTARASDTGPGPGETAWLVIPEPNIAFDPEYLFEPHAGVEIVSPVFIDESVETRNQWITNVKDMMGAVTSKIPPALSLNKSCAYLGHVGVGVTGDFTLAEVKKIAIVVLLYKEAIDNFHPTHRSVGGEVNDMLRPMRAAPIFAELEEEEIIDEILKAPTLENLQGQAPQ